MQRLNGIGVSPGVVAGRAVVLMQRAQVLRYRIAPSAFPTSWRGSSRAGCDRGSNCRTSARASRAGAVPSWRHSSMPSC